MFIIFIYFQVKLLLQITCLLLTTQVFFLTL